MQWHTLLVLLLTTGTQVTVCTHGILADRYRFSANLDDGYKLHWNFDLEDQTVVFAVNVSTKGWVGFGLSPDGRMPLSDVIIGWVDNDGNTTFNVSSH